MDTFRNTLQSNSEQNLKGDSDSFADLISSERLNKDVETLMNSSFWINALKNSHAFGIGTNLYCNFSSKMQELFYII